LQKSGAAAPQSRAGAGKSQERIDCLKRFHTGDRIETRESLRDRFAWQVKKERHEGAL
jgi:hypothetical protein